VPDVFSHPAGRQTIRTYLHGYTINKRDAHNNNWQSLKVHVHQQLLCLVNSLRKLRNLAFIIFELLRRIEPNSTTLYDQRMRSKSMYPWASAEIFPRRANVEILLILFRLLTMQCVNGRSQNALPLLPHWSVLVESQFNLSSQMFSTLRLSEILFFIAA